MADVRPAGYTVDCFCGWETVETNMTQAETAVDGHLASGCDGPWSISWQVPRLSWRSRFLWWVRSHG